MPAGPSDEILSRAARLRAAGASWPSVAAEVNRAVETVQKWPVKWPDRWHTALAEAERRVATEAAAEAVLILRQLLRAEDEKVRRDAARVLLDLRFRFFTPPDPSDQPTSPRSADARRLVAFLEAHSDEEVARLAADLHAADPAAPDLAALPGRDTCAG